MGKKRLNMILEKGFRMFLLLYMRIGVEVYG
jgi:hypothetical protein